RTKVGSGQAYLKPLFQSALRLLRRGPSHVVPRHVDGLMLCSAKLRRRKGRLSTAAGRSMTLPEKTREPYLVRSVMHAAELLRAFQSSAEALRLCDVPERTGFGKGRCFRLLHSLHHCGVLDA